MGCRGTERFTLERRTVTRQLVLSAVVVLGRVKTHVEIRLSAPSVRAQLKGGPKSLHTCDQRCLETLRQVGKPTPVICLIHLPLMFDASANAGQRRVVPLVHFSGEFWKLHWYPCSDFQIVIFTAA